MHSQMTDFEHMDLACDFRTERLLSTCKEKSREYSVSLFSLSKSNAMLAPRYCSSLTRTNIALESYVCHAYLHAKTILKVIQ